MWTFKAYNRPLVFIIVSHNRAYVNRGLSSCAQHANKMFSCRKQEFPSIGGIFTGHSCRPGHTWVSLVIRYDTRGHDDDSLIPRCCRISVTHDNVVSIRKHRAQHSRDGPSLLLFVNEPTFSLSSLLVLAIFIVSSLAPRGAAMFPLRLFNKVFDRIEIDDREFSR